MPIHIGMDSDTPFANKWKLKLTQTGKQIEGKPLMNPFQQFDNRIMSVRPDIYRHVA